MFKSVKGNVPHQETAKPSFQGSQAAFRVSTLCSQRQQTWESSDVLWSMVAFFPFKSIYNNNEKSIYIYVCVYLLKYSWLMYFQMYLKVTVIYTYVCVNIFFRLFSIIGYYNRQVWSPVLYSRSLSFICFIYSDVYLLISNSEFIPRYPFLPW